MSGPRQAQLLFLGLAFFLMLTVLATADPVLAIRRMAWAMLFWLIGNMISIFADDEDHNRYAGT
jgi:hypothetical protein